VTAAAVPGLRFAASDPRVAPVPALLAEVRAEGLVVYGTAEGLDPADIDPADLSPPHGTFLVGTLGGRVVAGGGLRALPGVRAGTSPGGRRTAEIKRMYVRPPWRQRGVAGALLAALEDAARALGYQAARLDTGPRQPHALRLYRRAGYVAVAPFNDNPAAFWGEKDLAGPPGGGARS
jgi:GNAT superfamily N-acetyltransferase